MKKKRRLPSLFRRGFHYIAVRKKPRLSSLFRRGFHYIAVRKKPRLSSLFRRGFHYIAVREMEMEIPIPSLPGDLTAFMSLSAVLSWYMYVFDELSLSHNFHRTVSCDGYRF